MTSNKTLIVVRHGHAIDGDDDFARTLSRRGSDEVQKTGVALQAANTHVDHVLSSSAPRALETAQKLASFCGFFGVVEQTPRLYLAEPRTLLEAVTRVDDSVQVLMLVGHNPGLSSFVEQLTGQRAELATAEVRSLTLDVESWAHVTVI